MDYQPFFCEENIWKLCDRELIAGSLVVFISNLNREVILFQQRAGNPLHGIVAWDYHVILAEPHSATKSWLIHDFDSRLGTPCSWNTYRDQTFRSLPLELSRWTPQFRVIPAEQFHQEFASDRTHMLDTDGEWMHPPPPWPPIGEGSNLMSILDFQDPSWGPAISLHELDSALPS